MTVRLYSSLDASAPQLGPASGTLIAVLDACLVDGYGSKAPAGWTKAFANSTTGASYRQGAGSNGLYLNVDDSAGAIVRARGFEEMSAYGVGVGPFPTDLQLSGGNWLLKHDGLAGNRAWWLVATERTFYFWTAYDANASQINGALFIFGDITPSRSSDPYATMIGGALGAPTPTSWPGTWADGGTFANSVCLRTTISQSPDAPYSGHYMARSYTQLGGSAYVTKQTDLSRLRHGNFTVTATYLTGTNAYSYGHWFWNNAAFQVPLPNPADGALPLSAVTVSEGVGIRGVCPGLWCPLFDASVLNGQQYAGSGVLAGKTFLYLRCPYGSVALEVSDTW